MRKGEIDIITLGCSKNLVDAERLMRQLELAGYRCVHDSSMPKGEIAIINTCGFIGDAKEESIEMNSIMTMKSIYEGRIDDIKEHMESLKKDKRHLTIAVCVLAAVLLIFITVDVLVGSIGWIRF